MAKYTSRKTIYRRSGAIPPNTPFTPTEAELRAFGDILVSTGAAPPFGNPAPTVVPPAEPEVEPEDVDSAGEGLSEQELIDLIEPLNVDDTVALGMSGEVDVTALLQAERASKNRRGVIRQLETLIR